jgi:diaminopimelate decarboxylase
VIIKADPINRPERSLLPTGPMRQSFRRHVRRRCEEADFGLVVDLHALEQRLDEAAAEAAAHSVQLLYAVKASSRPEVLCRAARFGLGFDVSNAREFGYAQAASTEATISLTPPGLPIGERSRLLAAFVEGDIHRWHCDSLSQLAELVRACPGRTVGIRVNMNGLARPADGFPCQPSRFGIRLDQLEAARDIAAAHGCRLRWIHVHHEAAAGSLASYAYAAEQILRVAKANYIEVESLDLGGGLKPTEDLGEFFKTIRDVVGPNVQLVFEPGQYWLTDCISLITQILDVKETSDYVLLLLDLAVVTHLQWSDGLRIPTLGQLIPGDPRPWRICGRSGDEDDVLAQEEVPVSPNGPIPRPGDRVALGNVASYSIELGCEFNGIPRAPVEFV